MKYDYCSLKGKRENNQDSILFASVKEKQIDVKFTHHDSPDDYSLETMLPNNMWVAIVADGMGGLSNGEKASYLTTSLFLDYLEEMYTPYSDINKLITDNILKINSSVKINSPNSGSTIAGCICINDSYYLFNVGDSTLLALDEENIIIKSVSHSITKKSHIITDYIGMEQEPNIHLYKVKKLKKLLIFTDGMDNLLEEYGNQLLYIDLTTKQLCQNAISKGSQDNITCIKIDI